MGGKKLSVANQQNPSTVNVLPHSINIDNGSQAPTMLTAAHVETIKTNIKVNYFDTYIYILFCFVLRI